MWISKKKYEKLASEAKEVNSYRNIMDLLGQGIEARKIIRGKDYILTSPEVFDELYRRAEVAEDKAREIEAEAAWYKNKFFQMKEKYETL